MMEAKSNRVDPMRCHHCGGVLMPLTTIDRQTGSSSEEFVCIKCGRQADSGDSRKPLSV